MPTSTGAETISERLTRLRAELVRVRATIARHENNGASSNIGGAQITEVSYERALKRQTSLENQIATLEARLAGTAGRPGIALGVTISQS